MPAEESWQVAQVVGSPDAGRASEKIGLWKDGPAGGAAVFSPGAIRAWQEVHGSGPVALHATGCAGDGAPRGAWQATRQLGDDADPES